MTESYGAGGNMCAVHVCNRLEGELKGNGAGREGRGNGAGREGGGERRGEEGMGGEERRGKERVLGIAYSSACAASGC